MMQRLLRVGTTTSLQQSRLASANKLAMAGSHAAFPLHRALSSASANRWPTGSRNGLMFGAWKDAHVRFYAKAQMTADIAYHTLRVHRRTNMKDIKQAYLELAKLYHPDRNPDDESAKEKFIQVQQAYEYLKANHAPDIVIEHSYRPPTAYEDFDPADENAMNRRRYDFTNQPRGNARQPDLETNYRDFIKSNRQSYSKKFSPEGHERPQESSNFIPLLLTLAFSALMVHFFAPKPHEAKKKKA